MNDLVIRGARIVDGSGEKPFVGDVAIKDDSGGHAKDRLVANVYSIPTDIPVERLHSRLDHYDKYATHLDDVDSYFPITRLHEAAADGTIGGVASRAHGVYTAYSQRRTLTIDGPEVLKRCREDGVDAVLLTPI